MPHPSAAIAFLFAILLSLAAPMAQGATFTSTDGTSTIPASGTEGAASLFPSTITVSGIPSGQGGAVTVTLTGLSHTWPADLDIVLVAPDGKRTMLLSDCGGGTDVVGVNLVFDDAAPSALTGAPIASGTYRPSSDDIPAADVLTLTAPPGPYPVELGVVSGNSPNGVWSLYAFDDAGFDAGSLTSWSITFAPPANDNFATPTVLTTSASGVTAGATVEPGEPNPSAATALHSVWYSWTAPSTGSFVVQTTLNAFDTTLGVYTGATLGALTEVGFNDNRAGAVSGESAIVFSATNAVTYRIRLDGASASDVGYSRLVVFPAAVPGITSSLTWAATIDVPFTYSIVASNLPTSYAATGLPAGLALDPVTGVISGVPTGVGTYPVDISATNVIGTTHATVTITLDDTPVLTSTTIASTVVNVPYSFTFTALHSPTSWTATPLPAGMVFDTTTGVLSGTPTVTGNTNISISATNGTGTDAGTFALQVNPSTAPVVTSDGTASAEVGQAFTYQIVATNSPTGFFAGATLPPGLTIDGTTGLVFGTPTTAVPWFNLIVAASNASGNGFKTVRMSIAPPSAPVHSDDDKKCGLGGLGIVLMLGMGMVGWRRRSRN